ncbi:MAG: Rare lipoprotein [Gemmatimonadetes bacterium]|nr:Rare lipoprotein [Gemmatimonadota bacterium]
MPFRRIPGFALSLSTLLLGGCLYGFSGGGLPSDVKTVAVLPFENITTDPTLTAEINAAVREAVENRLGLRQAGENQANAVVTGTITRYEPDLPVAFQGAENNKVEVTRRLLQITVDVRIINRETEAVIWERKGLMVEGDYETGKERDGRKKALEKLTTNIVDGAQSQW